MPRFLVSALVACALAGGVGVASAGAAGLSPPVADCQAHNQLTRSYTAAQLRNALATMPADIAQYTACPDIIRKALLQKIGKLSGGSGSGGGSFLPTWLLVVVVLLVLGAAGFGAVALRNRRQGETGPGG